MARIIAVLENRASVIISFLNCNADHHSRWRPPAGHGGSSPQWNRGIPKPHFRERWNPSDGQVPLSPCRAKLLANQSTTHV